MGDLVVPVGRTVKDLVAAYLAEWHLTQGAFAATLGLSQKHMSQVVRGNTSMSPGIAVAFEAGTGIPVGVWVAVSGETQAARLRVSRARWLEQIQSRMDDLRRTVDERSVSGRPLPKRAES